ncbi:hypothetical protein ACFLIM_42445 [Nonomuraea sp. M3C6]|uniref:Uncharacterized protein n=1 Tax=Nonomuraea marmarensis TaxID=3351344 RepID=A0ABW7AR01_9ACTN
MEALTMTGYSDDQKKPRGFAPSLLSAATELLERVGELPPLSVTCNIASVLAGVLATPASLAASEDDQSAVVHGIARAMRWPCRQEDLDGGGALRARLSVVDRATMAQVREVVMTVPDDGWSGYGGTGVLPTGTDLTVSIGRY